MLFQGETHTSGIWELLPTSKGTPGCLRPKILVKSPCYLLLSLGFAAYSVLNFFSSGSIAHQHPGEHFDVLWAVVLLLLLGLVQTERFGGLGSNCFGLAEDWVSPCHEKSLEGEQALSSGLLCFSEQSFCKEMVSTGHLVFVRFSQCFCMDT